MMIEHNEHTLERSAIIAGIGLHTGQTVRMVVRPASSGTGIIFVRTDIVAAGIDNVVPAKAHNVTQTRLGTVISNEAGVSVSTIEHLMAALAALGVDNVTIGIDGPEVPIMDGSSEPFVRLLDQAGFRRQMQPQSAIEIIEPIIVTEGDKSAAFYPADRFEMRFEIEFDNAAIGHQVIDLEVTEMSFRSELSSARSFGFLQGVEALRASGLARGASYDNVIVIDGERVANPEGLRFADEFVRHKALDAIGDLYVLGMPILGRFVGVKAGHGLNNALVRALLSKPEAYRVVTRTPVLQKVV